MPLPTIPSPHNSLACTGCLIGSLDDQVLCLFFLCCDLHGCGIDLNGEMKMKKKTNTCSENLGPGELCVLRDVPAAYNFLNYYIQITDEVSYYIQLNEESMWGRNFRLQSSEKRNFG